MRVDLDSRAARLDASALEHGAPLRLLLLEALLERELAGNRQHEDRVDDSFRADQLGGAGQRAGADVGAEDRHQRGPVVELGEFGRALGALGARGAPQVEPMLAAV